MTILNSSVGALRLSLAKGETLIVRNYSGTETVTGSTVSREDASSTLGAGAVVYGPQSVAASIVLSTTGTLDYQTVMGDPTPAVNALVELSGGSPVGIFTPDGQPVGGGMGVVQSNLATNGDMSSGTSGWVGVRSNISAASNVLTVAGTSGYPGAYLQIPTVAGKLYRLSVNVASVGGTTINVGAANNAAGGTDLARRSVSAAGVVTLDFLAISSLSAVWLLAQTAGTPTFAVRDVCIYEVGSTARDVVIDTDMDSDCDDVAALAIACLLHRAGVITLRAVTVASSTLYAAPCVRAVLNWYGLYRVPVGTYKGSALKATSAYNQAVAAQFGAPGQTRNNFPDAVSVLRAVLAEALPGSVTLASIGPMTNISALISSAADYYSTATGLALINSKVRSIVAVGGDYASGTEYNFVQDPAAAAAVFTNITTVPIYCVGYTVGNSITCAPPASDTTANNPTKLAYSLFAGGVTTRQSWDPLAVAFAAYGPAFGLGYGGTNGTNTVNSSTGANTWSSTAGNVSYASIATRNTSVGDMLNFLLAES